MNNPSAFPGFQFTEGHGPHRRVPDPTGGDSVWECYAPGMTLRDYFAAKVMQALVQETSVTADDYFKAIAKLAYGHADAMLAAREPQGERSNG